MESAQFVKETNIASFTRAHSDLLTLIEKCDDREMREILVNSATALMNCITAYGMAHDKMMAKERKINEVKKLLAQQMKNFDTQEEIFRKQLEGLPEHPRE